MAGVFDNIVRDINNFGKKVVDTVNDLAGGQSGIDTNIEKKVKKSVNEGALPTADAIQLAATQADKRKRIQVQLEEMIRLRQQAPGRSQTLLTSQLTPSPTNNQTLLTGNSLTGK